MNFVYAVDLVGFYQYGSQWILQHCIDCCRDPNIAIAYMQMKFIKEHHFVERYFVYDTNRCSLNIKSIVIIDLNGLFHFEEYAYRAILQHLR